MADTFKNVEHRTNPADEWFAITPHNTTDMPVTPRGVFCTASGTAQMVDRKGTVMAVDMLAGQYLPLRPVRINATSTTGTFYGLL